MRGPGWLRAFHSYLLRGPLPKGSPTPSFRVWQGVWVWGLGVWEFGGAGFSAKGVRTAF